MIIKYASEEEGHRAKTLLASLIGYSETRKIIRNAGNDNTRPKRARENTGTVVGPAACRRALYLILTVLISQVTSLSAMIMDIAEPPKIAVSPHPRVALESVSNFERLTL